MKDRGGQGQEVERSALVLASFERTVKLKNSLVFLFEHESTEVALHCYV